MAATEAAAFRSLGAAFQRKGIVAGPAFGLAPPVQSLIDALKANCNHVLSTSPVSPQRPASAAPTRELYSNIQLWKERSLHQTIQAIDGAARGSADTSALHESHIQAIELHGQAAKELFELVASFLQRTAVLLDRQLDDFASQLAGVLNELIKPELEEQLEHERMIAERLVEQKMQLERAMSDLQTSHDSLSARLDAIENAPTGGGDAILCNKLRGRVRQLAESEKELRGRVESLAQERDTCKFETTRLQQKVEEMQHTINFTCAMHEKETRQLVALAHMNYDQLSRVMKSSSSALSALNPLTSYDSNSGRTVVYQSGTGVSTSRPTGSPSKTRLVTFLASSPPSSPNQKRRLQDAAGGTCPGVASITGLLPQSPCTRPTTATVSSSSPRGEVLRPFAPQPPSSGSFSSSKSKSASN